MNESSIPPEADDRIRSSPDVSVIVVIWNLKELLGECLDSIRLSARDLDVETIVVDNASTDGSADMVASEYPWVTLIRNEDNLGFSRANNQAIDMARGRYIFLLNNDAVLQGDALADLVSFMDEHEQAGACGPRVVNADGTMQVRSKGRFPSISTALAHFFLPAGLQNAGGVPLGFYEHQDLIGARPMDWVSGCALMVRRRLVESVGPLDADVFMYCEDVDWCLRISKAGWPVWYVPSVVVLHYGGQSMKKQMGRVVGAHKAGLEAFYSKYHGRPANVVFRVVLWAGYATKGIGWEWSALGRRTGFESQTLATGPEAGRRLLKIALYYLGYLRRIERMILETVRRSEHEWVIFTSHYYPSRPFRAAGISHRGTGEGIRKPPLFRGKQRGRDYTAAENRS